MSQRELRLTQGKPCVCACVCAWGGACLCARVSVRTHVSVYMRIHVCEWAYVCVRVHTCVCGIPVQSLSLACPLLLRGCG